MGIRVCECRVGLAKASGFKKKRLFEELDRARSFRRPAAEGVDAILYHQQFHGRPVGAGRDLVNIDREFHARQGGMDGGPG